MLSTIIESSNCKHMLVELGKQNTRTETEVWCVPSIKELFSVPLRELLLDSTTWKNNLQMPWSKFTFPNLLLQRDDYCIHAAHEHLDDAFLAGLFSFEKIKAVKPVTKVKGKVNNWQTWAIYWHHFNQRAALGAISKPPLKDNTLIHARYVNFFDRENASFENVEFILKKYSTVLQLLRGMPHLLENRPLNNEDILKKVW